MEEFEMDSHDVTDDDLHARTWAIRWRRIMAVAIVMLLVCYLAAWLLAVPGFVQQDSYIFDLWFYSPWILWGFVAVGLVHLVANVLLSIEEVERPTHWLRFLRDCLLFLIIPAVPVAGVLWGIGKPVDRTIVPPLVTNIACGLFVICPLITFFQLRKLALRIGQVRLARLAALVAIANPIVLVLMSIRGLVWAGFRVGPLDALGMAAFLVPRVALMFFALASIYVLFELAGLYFTSARRARSVLLPLMARPA
jgi:hypothetical protein